jgi:hypothetical protein
LAAGWGLPRGIGALTVAGRAGAARFAVATCFGFAGRAVALATRFGADAFFTTGFVPGLWATVTAFRAVGLEVAGLATGASDRMAASFAADAGTGAATGAGFGSIGAPVVGDGPVNGTMSGPTEGPAVWARPVPAIRSAPTTIMLAIPFCTALHLPPAG